MVIYKAFLEALISLVGVALGGVGPLPAGSTVRFP